MADLSISQLLHTTFGRPVSPVWPRHAVQRHTKQACTKRFSMPDSVGALRNTKSTRIGSLLHAVVPSVKPIAIRLNAIGDSDGVFLSRSGPPSICPDKGSLLELLTKVREPRTGEIWTESLDKGSLGFAGYNMSVSGQFTNASSQSSEHSFLPATSPTSDITIPLCRE